MVVGTEFGGMAFRRHNEGVIKWRLIIIGGGLVVATGVLAHDDFDVHDEVQPEAATQQVVVPGAEDKASNELIDSYQRALEAAQRTGNVNLVQQLMESRNAASVLPSPAISVAPAVQVSDLPFPLLASSLDRDQDGLSDSDEINLMTNANDPDTDHDGYADGIEVVRGYNPLIPSPGDKITYTEPSGVGDDIYLVTGLRLGDSGDQERLTVTGTGPNNSLVALIMIGGENKLWVTRTDMTGRFIYVSGDTLDTGSYKIYAAAVSVDGKTLAASQALSFERTDTALLKSGLKPTVTNNENNPDKIPSAYIIGAAAGAVGLGLGGALWLIIRRRRLMGINRLPSI